MFCSIYIIRNTKNDKVYIGQTWKTIRKRFLEHKLHRNDTKRRSCKLANAMNKHGVDNFYIELLVFVHTQDIADYWESFFIDKSRSISSGYNIKAGGSHGRHSQETIKKISNAKKGIPFSEQHKNNISKSKIGTTNYHLVGNKFWVGRTHSVKTRQLLSNFGLGRKLSTEIRQKISNSSKGKLKLSIRKFNQETELLIKEEYEMERTTLDSLSKKYNCSIATIHRLVKRKNDI
jgi:group I intron endonuclease